MNVSYFTKFKVGTPVKTESQFLTIKEVIFREDGLFYRTKEQDTLFRENELSFSIPGYIDFYLHDDLYIRLDRNHCECQVFEESHLTKTKKFDTLQDGMMSIGKELGFISDKVESEKSIRVILCKDAFVGSYYFNMIANTQVFKNNTLQHLNEIVIYQEKEMLLERLVYHDPFNYSYKLKGLNQLVSHVQCKKQFQVTKTKHFNSTQEMFMHLGKITRFME